MGPGGAAPPQRPQRDAREEEGCSPHPKAARSRHLSIVIWGGLLGLAAIVLDWHLLFSQETPGTGPATTASPSP